MVAIVSGNSLGLNLTSLGTLGRTMGNPPEGRNGQAAYVNVANGNLVVQNQDDYLASRGLDAAAVRTYNSQGLFNDDNGDNWSSGAWLQPLTLAGTLNTTGSTVQRTDRDAAVAMYTYDATRGLYLSTDGEGAHDTIAYVAADNQLEWRDGASGQSQRYEASGSFRLLSSRDTSGNVLAYAYDVAGRLASVTSASGEATLYDYSGNNLTQIRTVAGGGETSTRVRYDYDAANRLSSVTVDLTPGDGSVADGRVYRTTYTYDGTSKRITGIAQTDGSSLAFSYIDVGGGNFKVATVKDGLGNTTQFNYSAGYSTVTDPAGSVTRYDFDTAGRLTRLVPPGVADGSTGPTLFSYDVSGRHVRERVTQGGVVYQDNHMAYDTLGRLRDVSDARVHIALEYDKVGNRTRVSTSVNYQGVTGETASNSDRHFKYDSMNRQVVVDAVDASGNIGQQGHLITYDRNGNRSSDTYWGSRVVTTDGQQVIAGYNEDGSAIYRTAPTTYTTDTGWTKELYSYDALNRLQAVERDGVQVDLRYYDGADRVIQSGPAGALPTQYADILNQGVVPGEMNGKETRINRYDANGRLLHQKILKSDNSAKVDISWDTSESIGPAWTADGYDAVGNVRGYVVQNHEGGGTNEYTTSLARFEGYKAGVTNGVSTKLNPGTTTQHYDANGFLVGVTDSTQSNNNRTFVNDASGIALYVNQAGRVQRQLVVNGEVLGLYGAGVDPGGPASGGNNNPNFANLVDFDFGYARISASYPNASPGAYQVRTGDTLQSIAQAAYGDSSLWYRIAEANGLGGDDDVRVGQTLNIPNRVSTISNNASTFKPYDPSRIEGDMTPSMAMPEKDGCGGIGQILMVIVAVVVTVFTAGAMAGVAGTFLQTMAAGMSVVTGTAGLSAAATIGTLAVASAAGSVASQVVGLATGTIERFDWKGVALAAISGGVSGGTAGIFGTGIPALIVQSALSNALTQGISVAMGLQKKFDWKGVAAAAVGAGVGAGVGQALKGVDFGLGLLGNDLVKGALRGFAAGTAAAAARAGKVNVARVATDAFGNAIGSSLAGGASAGPADPLGDFIQKNMPAWEERQATYDKIVEVFSKPPNVDRSQDVAVAGTGEIGLGFQGRTAIIGAPTAIPQLLEHVRSNVEALKGQYGAAATANATRAATERALANMTEFAEATRGMTGATGDVTEADTPAYLPGVGYADATNTFPPVVVRASPDIGNTLPINGHSSSGSLREIGPVQGFFTFNPLGQALHGVGRAALDVSLGVPRSVIEVGNLVRDGWGYAANAVTPRRSAITGQAVAYTPTSGLLQSVQRNGVTGAVGLGLTGAVRNAPVIGLIAALGAPKRKWGDIGAEGLNTAFAAAGALSSGKTSSTTLLQQVNAKGIGFESGRELRAAMSPGPGEHIHHIVEQTPSNVARFSARSIHNTANALPVLSSTHIGRGSISAYYSSKQSFTDGLTVRQWLSTQSFEQQYHFGAQILSDFGVFE